jgi:hypothetical protein
MYIFNNKIIRTFKIKNNTFIILSTQINEGDFCLYNLTPDHPAFLCMYNIHYYLHI